MGTDPPPQLQGFDALYGLELTECSDELVRGRVRVRDELKQAGGLLHGGLYGAIAEGLAGRGTALALEPSGKLVLGLSNQTNVLWQIGDGTVLATAVRRHRGRTTWVWEVEISDEAGRLCALSRVTLAVKDA